MKSNDNDKYITGKAMRRTIKGMRKQREGHQMKGKKQKGIVTGRKNKTAGRHVTYNQWI